MLYRASLTPPSVGYAGNLTVQRKFVDRRLGHELWHFQHRLIRKILAHTVGVFLNLQLGRPPLDLDGLLVV